MDWIDKFHFNNVSLAIGTFIILFALGKLLLQKFLKDNTTSTIIALILAIFAGYQIYLEDSSRTLEVILGIIVILFILVIMFKLFKGITRYPAATFGR